MTAAETSPIEVAWEDLSAYAAGNTGVPYVHSFDSGRAGPHVMVNALTHGNEFCGRVAVRRLLDDGIRPTNGRLTLSFANVAAHDSFDPDQPADSRFVDRDFNRIWSDEAIDEDTQSVEAARAREMRPVVRTVDLLLDLHSTHHCDRAFFVIPKLPRPRDLAAAIGTPPTRVLLKDGGMHGPTLMEYRRFVDPGTTATAVVAECGRHWTWACADMAVTTAAEFLRHADVIDEDAAMRLRRPIPADRDVDYEVTLDLFAETDAFRYVRSFSGFDALADGEIIAWDGDRAIRPPHPDCVVLLARPEPKRGGEAISFGRIVPRG